MLAFPHLPSPLLLNAMQLLPIITPHTDRCDILLCPVLHTEQPPLALYDLLLALANLHLFSILAPNSVTLMSSCDPLLYPTTTCKNPSLPVTVSPWNVMRQELESEMFLVLRTSNRPR